MYWVGVLDCFNEWCVLCGVARALIVVSGCLLRSEIVTLKSENKETVVCNNLEDRVDLSPGAWKTPVYTKMKV